MGWSSESTFTSTSDGVKIAYATLVNKSNKNKPTIAFFTGWKEHYDKYLPFLTTLHTQSSFNIFTMDHRSQGLSGDTPGTRYAKGNEDSSGKRICYVEDFESTYVHDMRQFLETIVKPKCDGENSSICVVAHSMGGLLACRVAELTGNTLFDRMVLSSPCMQHKNVLNLGLFDWELPLSVASRLASVMVKGYQGPTLADGRDTNASQPTTEALTHSEENRAAWNKMRTEKPQIVLAGASFSFAHAMFDAEHIAFQNAQDIKIPTLVFVSEEDAFVYSTGTAEFMDKVDKEKSMLVGPVANSYHELLLETDDIVKPIMECISAFASLEKSESGFPDSMKTVIKTVPLSEKEPIPPPGCVLM